MRSLPALALALLCAFPTVGCAALTGTVVAIPDGDTLVVRVGERVLNVDLTDVDAPEIGQAYGKRAWVSLVQMCDAKAVTLDDLGIDRNRRVFGQVACNGVDAAAEQVKRGLAWVHDRHESPAESLLRFQVEARAERRGLWSDAAAVPPSAWQPPAMQRN